MLLCVAIALPVIVLMAQGSAVTLGPPWVWVAVFCGFLAGYFFTTILSGHPSRALTLTTFSIQQACALAAVLLLDGGMGFVAVILVFGAALSCYVLPAWGTGLVIALNTATIFVATSESSLENQALNSVFYLAIQLVSVMTVFTWRSQERAKRKLQSAHIELAATNALLEQSTRAEERLRISRDLHDVVGHQLTALALELEIASHQTAEPAREHVLGARAIAKDLLRDVRDVVSQLREERGSLENALRAAIDGVSTPEVILTVDPDVPSSDASTTALVRATQEIVTNAVRHAESATTLTLTLTQEGRSIVLRAVDDGWGPTRFDIGNGLRGMRERAESLGGTASFGRGTRGGFEVRVEVPV